MPSTKSPASPRDATAYDAVIVGGSLSGCATAIGLGRAGLRVAVVEKQPDPQAFKRVCSHAIQASGVPAIERLGLLEPIEAGPAERMVFSAAARDPKAATTMDAFATRLIRPQEAFPRMLPRAIAVNARHALAHR